MRRFCGRGRNALNINASWCIFPLLPGFFFMYNVVGHRAVQMEKDTRDAIGNAIFDYVMAGGKFVSLTEDSGFLGLIKDILHRTLGLPRDCFIQHTRLDDVFALLHQDVHARYVVCLDRSSLEHNLPQVMETILRLCPAVRIIVLTKEVDQYTTALLIEQGAHNIITKPISLASFSEKLAYTIAPQGRLSKLIDKGKRFLDGGNWGEALLVAEDILKQKPESAAAYMIKGDAYRGMEMMDRAEDMYQKAARSSELYLAPLKRLAELYAQSGDPVKQLQYLRRLNEISPLDTQRILNIGELEISRGNTSQAEEMFEQVMKLAKREAADMLSNLSSRIATICANRDPEMAIRYSKRALDLRGGDLSPSDIATVNILGISLRKQGKWREAIAEYRRVLAVVPDNPGLLYNMAMAYNEGAEVPKALAMVRKALEIDPGLPGTGKNVAYNIGVIFERSGLSGEPFFKKAYEQDPNDKTMWEALKRSQALA
jgi:tetratricopeptide (TPR) repeat protein